ncbi:MAG TPA: glycosyltransferase family 2 protein [Candidatus Methylomirabilis sp.]|nr:glycosyltransferase family 2 protein [Candidatus Methylomirabilis sp.]
MPESAPKISFVTVCYNTPNLIRVLLRGVERAGFQFSFEYFLVDNGKDGTAESVRAQFPWVTVVDAGGNVGFAAGNNAAFRRATGEYVMLVNPDLTIFPGEMEKLIAYADEHPDVGIVGPRVNNPNGTRQESCTRFPHALMPLYSRTFLGKTRFGRRAVDWYHQRDMDHDADHETDSLFGAALLIRKNALDEFGLFDERFFMYYEDVDLCRRAWMTGWKVRYAPSARFAHYHQRQSLIRAPWELFTNRVARVHIASGIRYFLKYRGIPHPPKVARDAATFIPAPNMTL